MMNMDDHDVQKQIKSTTCNEVKHEKDIDEVEFYKPESYKQLNAFYDESDNVEHGIVEENYIKTEKDVQLSDEVEGKAWFPVVRDISSGKHYPNAVQCIQVKKEIDDSEFESEQKNEDDSIQLDMSRYDVESMSLNQQLKQEEGDNPNKPCKCEICGKAHAHRSQLKIHMMKHTGEKPHPCPTCGKCFAMKSDVKNHMRLHTGEKPYKCDVCNYATAQRSNLTHHMVKHTGERPYKCSMCDMGFGRSNTLNQHMRTHSKEKPHKCYVCDKNFANIYHLRRHLLTHSEDKPYKCEHCNKGFTTPHALKEHLPSHSGEKPQKCELCGKCFLHSASLRNHIMRHIGEKPHKCEKCGKCFVESSHLRRHKQTHDKEMFSCQLCNLTFKQSKFEKHMRSVHCDMPHKCEICGKGFARAAQIIKHMKNHETGRIEITKQAIPSPPPLVISPLTSSGNAPTSLPLLLPQVSQQPQNSDLPLEMNNAKQVFHIFTKECTKSFMNDDISLKKNTKPIGADTTNGKITCKLESSLDTNGDTSNDNFTHLKEKTHTCSVCDKNFATIYILRRHLLTHSEDKPFKCEHCNKGFTTAHGLREHLPSHSGEKPKKCEVCGKCFLHSASLRIHLMRHKGEKPHVCEKCGKCFVESSHLRRHRQTHDKEMFSCQICNLTFKQSKFEKHMKLVHGNMPHKCEICGKGFARAAQIRKHMKGHETRREHTNQTIPSLAPVVISPLTSSADASTSLPLPLPQVSPHPQNSNLPLEMNNTHNFTIKCVKSLMNSDDSLKEDTKPIGADTKNGKITCKLESSLETSVNTSSDNSTMTSQNEDSSVDFLANTNQPIFPQFVPQKHYKTV